MEKMEDRSAIREDLYIMTSQESINSCLSPSEEWVRYRSLCVKDEPKYLCTSAISVEYYCI